MIFDAILFDLDGTLLPMDNDQFTKGYMHYLSSYVEPLGYKKEDMIQALWKGVLSMVKNNGSRYNEEAFWDTFAQLLGPHVQEHIPEFDQFYRTEFHKAKALTGENPLAKDAVALARQKAKKVILATNPLFPTVGVETRMSWVGLSLDDFDLVTDYSNSTSCKPNPAYYQEIMQKMNLNPEKCLMIGNNAQEDVQASNAAGIAAYLVKDCLICEGEMPACPQGSFRDMLTYLKNL